MTILPLHPALPAAVWSPAPRASTRRPWRATVDFRRSLPQPSAWPVPPGVRCLSRGRVDAGRVRLRADGTGGRRAPGRGHAAGPTLSYYPRRLTVPVRRARPAVAAPGQPMSICCRFSSALPPIPSARERPQPAGVAAGWADSVPGRSGRFLFVVPHVRFQLPSDFTSR